MNNQPAFPIKQPLSNDALGLTMLDYFAAKALVAGSSDSKLPPAYSFAEQALEALNQHCRFSTRDKPDAMDNGIVAIKALEEALK